jgi:hypothetical protein
MCFGTSQFRLAVDVVKDRVHFEGVCEEVAVEFRIANLEKDNDNGQELGGAIRGATMAASRPLEAQRPDWLAGLQDGSRGNDVTTAVQSSNDRTKGPIS